ncbi:hypothetical protein E4U43_001090 [Claviceps pusilla]|uniref:C2H2 type master regulator of conidiophore development brlA n=1 Tax=Claviceps pusilla TaxID=123648 RepID=A0A9P7NAT5_9HYPO|nr:hypothetical protein E4U43_001090 [Claviceps pusilla]
MQARNAAGRRVSLLNDDSVDHEKSQLYHRLSHQQLQRQSQSQPQPQPQPQPQLQLQPQHRQPQRQQLQQQLPLGFQPATGRILSRPHASPGSSSSGSSLNAPEELWRSDSDDSQMSNDPVSPLTPSVDYAYPRGGLYGSELPPKRPAYADSSRATSYDDDAPPPAAVAAAAAAAVAAPGAPSSASDRPAKRYPCRYRESHGCEKTFTTSGHASRHSKIHTAEKAVQCTFPGCQKKFTRADNMKQHLETHYKDKSRLSASQRAQKAALAEARRPPAPGRSRSSTCTTTASSVCSSKSDVMQWESDAYTASSQPPLASPTTATSWETRISNRRPPATVTSPNSGLDALAMAVACQADTDASMT